MLDAALCFSKLAVSSRTMLPALPLALVISNRVHADPLDHLGWGGLFAYCKRLLFEIFLPYPVLQQMLHRPVSRRLLEGDDLRWHWRLVGGRSLQGAGSLVHHFIGLFFHVRRFGGIYPDGSFVAIGFLRSLAHDTSR